MRFFWNIPQVDFRGWAMQCCNRILGSPLAMTPVMTRFTLAYTSMRITLGSMHTANGTVTIMG